MEETRIGSKRAQAMRFVLFTQRVSRALAHDKEDRQSADMLMQLTEAIRMRMGASACTYEDIMHAIHGARVTGYVREDDLPDERTPSERPSAIALETPAESAWRRFLRERMGWRL